MLEEREKGKRRPEVAPKPSHSKNSPLPLAAQKASAIAKEILPTALCCPAAGRFWFGATCA